jgi:glucan 1,3-beta-glucosidase
MKKGVRGVNLGGWLVLEKWITPSLFKDMEALDEYSFCLENGKKAGSKLKKHRESFITEKDFKRISEIGLNAVRIPVGYWIFGDEKPFIGATNNLDRAFSWAQKFNLGVVIDLHCAKGSQNGWDHSGKLGDMFWHQDRQNINQSLKVVQKLAKRYSKEPNLIGIELLNEPRWDVPMNILVDYYKRGYELVRTYCREDVAVICHDGFRPLEWQGIFPKDQFINLVLDLHLYQCFTEDDIKLNMVGHLEKTHNQWRNELATIQQSLPVIVGEWSLGINQMIFSGFSEDEEKLVLKSFGDAQIEEFNKTNGWFFWTYKTEDLPGWSLLSSVEQGILSPF